MYTYLFEDLEIEEIFTATRVSFSRGKICDSIPMGIISKDERIPIIIKIIETKDCCGYLRVEKWERKKWGMDSRTDFVVTLTQSLTKTFPDSFFVPDADLDLIEKEAKKVDLNQERLEIITKDNHKIIFLKSGLYEAITSKGESIPFEEICPISVKAGLAQFIGYEKFYPAFAIISKWLKKKGDRG